MDLEPIDLARIRKEQQIVVRRGGEKSGNKILFLGSHPDLAFAAAPLRTVERDGIALDVPRMRDRDHHLFLRDQILDVDVRRFRNDLRAPLVLIFFPEGLQLILDDLPHQRLGIEHRLQIGDALDDLRQALEGQQAEAKGQE